MNQTDYQNNTPAPSESKSGFMRVLLGLIPLFILIGLILGSVLLNVLAPEADRRAPPAVSAPKVEVMPIIPRNYSVVINSYGTVQPRTESILVAQVGGQVININPSLREGGFFEEGGMLLQIDQRDYLANVKISEAALLDARQALAQEEARSDQAKADWERLGNTGSAPELVLRTPQLNAARARVESAQSALRIAQLNLERTVVRAPFAGRVRSKSVDVGQVVNPGSQIAQIWATDYVEIRLPLRDSELALIDLPERYRTEKDKENQPSTPVEIFSSLVENTRWQGYIVRTESAIDERSRQLHCVAQIDDPFGAAAEGRTPLKIGEYVTAKIQGRTIHNAIVIPVTAIYQSDYVYVVENELLQQRRIRIAWQDDEEAIIQSGLMANDQLVLTSLGQVSSGLKVQIVSDDDDASASRQNPVNEQGGSSP